MNFYFFSFIYDILYKFKYVREFEDMVQLLATL